MEKFLKNFSDCWERSSFKHFVLEKSKINLKKKKNDP